jgi:hypothetical protein
MLLFLTIIAITLISVLSATISIYIVENIKLEVPRLKKGAVIASISTLLFFSLSLLLFLIAWPAYG